MTRMTESTLFPLSDIFTSRTQPVLQAMLRWLANYHVTLVGQLPDRPSLLLPYPHSEHIDSILLPARKTTLVAARDTFFRSAWQRVLLASVLDTIPLSRKEDFSHTRFKEEIAMQQDVLQRRKKHVVVYPQGTRRGAAESVVELQTQIKKGVPLMARHLEVPVIPVGIHHPVGYTPRKGETDAWREAQAAWRRGAWPTRREVTVRIGEALPLEVLKDNELFFATLAQELFTLAHTPTISEAIPARTVAERHRPLR